MDKENLYEELKNRIVTLKYKPEQVLNEKELMQTYNIGRTPLREVLLDLQRDGLVNILPRYGTLVTSLSLRDFCNLIQLRPTLEELVAEIAFDNLSKEKIDEFKKILERVDAIISEHAKSDLPEEIINELRALEAKIHLITYEATTNPYLVSLCRQLQTNTERYWHYIYNSPQDSILIKQFSDHKKIYEALAGRDKAGYKRLVREHTMNYFENILSSLSVAGKPLS